MVRVFGLALTAAVLALGLCSCTRSEGPTNSATATASPTPARTTVATATPTSSTTAPTTASVKGSNFKWVDDASGTAVTTIKVGGTVTWTIVSGDHTLQRVAKSAENGCDELDASFDADDMSQPVTRTFTKVGVFGYHCGKHGGTPSCKNPPGGAPGRMPGVIKVVP